MAVARSQVVDLVKASLEQSDVALVELDGMAVEDLAAVQAIASAVTAAARRVESEAKTRMVPQLGKGGWARLGATVWRVVPDRKWKVRPERHTEFFAWVESSGATRRVFNPDTARIGALRQLLEGHVDTETGEVGMGVFVDETEGELAVQVMPVDRAPKFIQDGLEGVYPR